MLTHGSRQPRSWLIFDVGQNMKRLLSIITALFADAVSANENPLWPDLKGVAYLSSRAATKEDVDAGRAVFLLADAGKPIGVPVKITIPQYAYHVDSETKKRTPCVIIQAEEARGQKLIGCRLLDGQIMAGTFPEFVFIGVKAPKPE